MKEKKVVVVLFHPLSAASRAANIFSQYQVVKMLHDEGLLHKVFCLSSDEKIDIPENYIFEVSKNKKFRIINLILNILARIPRIGKLRNQKEKIFEKVVLSNIPFDNVTLLYCSKPLFPDLIVKAKGKNVLTVLRASIAHPLYNYMLVRNEEERLGVISNSSYVNIRRANKILKSIVCADKILTNCRSSKDSFLVNNFSDFGEKLITYECMYTCLGYRGEVENRMQAKTIFIHVSHGNLIKGIQYLLAAWRHYRYIFNKSNAELHIIGKMDKNIETLINKRSYDSTSNLFFHSASKSPFEVIPNPTAFINSSLSEAGPSTLIEALSMGIPVITSKNCGLSDLICDGENGFRYEYNNINQLVKQMRWFDENKGVANEMKKKAIESVEKYSSGFCKNEMKMIFKSLI